MDGQACIHVERCGRGRGEKPEINIGDRDEGGVRDKEGEEEESEHRRASAEGPTERRFGLDG